MTRYSLKREQGEVLVEGVNDLPLAGLNKGALRPEEATEEVKVCDDLPLRGQGYDNDP